MGIFVVAMVIGVAAWSAAGTGRMRVKCTSPGTCISRACCSDMASLRTVAVQSMMADSLAFAGLEDAAKIAGVQWLPSLD